MTQGATEGLKGRVNAMRVLFVSNFFEPVTYGGYEQFCSEVALALAARGHKVGILTAATASPRYEDAAVETNLTVYRRLHLEVVGGMLSTIKRILLLKDRLDRDNESCVRETVDEFRPDVVMMWGMWNVPRRVPILFEGLCPERLAYYLCDYWPSLPSAYVQQLEAPSVRKSTAVLKRLVAAALRPRQAEQRARALQMNRTYCVSRATRDILVRSGVIPASASVIYLSSQSIGDNPMHTGRCAVDQRERMPSRPVRLLYTGRLTPEKGVETALAATRRLRDCRRVPPRLDIIGNGTPEYERRLRELVISLGVQDLVQFLGKVSRPDMPGIFDAHDVLVFPSEWQEPFARSVLEAMAAGLTVVASNTGGTPEAVVHDRTGLLFPAGDPNALADQIGRLMDEPATLARLAAAGQHFVYERFAFSQSVDRLESALRAIAAPDRQDPSTQPV
jgi:glycogen synthase